jgi:hypothetical protein
MERIETFFSDVFGKILGSKLDTGAIRAQFAGKQLKIRKAEEFPTKARQGVVMAQAKIEHVVKAVNSDDELADHLKKAEHHLIEAVKLFSEKNPPNRVSAYINRLGRAQELVTGLYREELIRIRGPIKLTVSAKKRKR